MKRILVLLMLMLLLHASMVCAQIDEPEAEITEENELQETIDDTRFRLTVSYLLEGEEKAFYRTVYMNDPGYMYNIASPEVEGYIPDTVRLVGSFPDETEVTVTYYLQAYSLNVHYRMLNGNAAAPDHSEQLNYGEEYSIEAPAVRGYVSVVRNIEGVMPGRPVELTIFYVPENAVFVY